MPNSFSQRHGLAGPPPGTLCRDQVPIGFRMFVIDLPKAYSIIQFDEVRNIVCKTLQQWPDETIQPYLDYKFRLQRCDWFRIYDVVERVYAFVWEKTWHSNPGAASLLAKDRSEEHTSELQSLRHLVCRLLLEKK